MKIVQTALVGVALIVAMPSWAGVTSIGAPDADYVNGTSKIDIPGSDYSTMTSISDGTLTMSFDSPLERGTVPSGGWASWGSPSDTESSTPVVLHAVNWDSSLTSVSIFFSSELMTFGFEAEPDPYEVHGFTLAFYSGDTLLGAISRDINGQAGARLLAGVSSVAFDHVVVSSDIDFAMAQFRYSSDAVGASPTPEPASWGMMLGGFGMLGGSLRYRRRKTLAIG